MWRLLTVAEVICIHDSVLNPGELQGLAGSKSLEGALARIDFRITYGVIKDGFDLAATYAVAIAQGHVFNDANKRTAYMCMHVTLTANGLPMIFEDDEVGDIIIKVAQGHMDERELGDWLRRKRMKELEEKQKE
jgi:death on curing protein